MNQRHKDLFKELGIVTAICLGGWLLLSALIIAFS
jgi:putative intracellular protease/amidase